MRCAGRWPISPTSTFKADDGLRVAFFAETTSKLLVFATNGRAYTLDAAKLPGGRGHGEPIRLFIELEQEADVVSVFRYEGGRKLIVGSKEGRGFIVGEDECVGNTRKGKQLLNVTLPDEARAIAPAIGELVAVIGDNRKMIVQGVGFCRTCVLRHLACSREDLDLSRDGHDR